MIKKRTRVALALLAAILSAPATLPASAQRPPGLDDLQRLVDAVAVSPDRFAGVSTDTLERVTIHVVGSSKFADAPAVTAAAQTLRAAGVRVTVVPAKYSLRQLEEVKARIRKRGPFAGPLTGTSGGSSVLTAYGVDPKSNQVAVAVTKLSAELADQVAREFGDTVKLSIEPRPTTAGRLNDSPPLYGGDRITGGPAPGRSCTSGFAMRNASNIIYEITAGHCFAPGTTVSTNTHLSRVAFHRFSNGEMDNALLENIPGSPVVYNNTSGRIWHGGLTSGAQYLPVTGGKDSCENCRVWAGGSFTGSGEATLTGPKRNLVVQDGGRVVTVTNTQRAIGDFAICEPGDSGGPVYAFSERGGVDAVGIITAVGANSSDCYYTSVPDILRYWQGTLVKS
ncbi:hypothetical protein ACI2LF_26840 [Kribbella sp. NPDC020789]